MANLPALQNRALATVRSLGLPKYFTKDEAQAIIYTHKHWPRKASKKANKIRIREYNKRFLCWFLWNTGARITEARNMRLSDIDTWARMIHIQTLKQRDHTRGHIRSLPKGFEFFQEIKAYVDINELAGVNDPLFNISDRTARRWVEDCCHAVGIKDERAHPHTFRHSFAVNCLLQLTPLAIIQKWLGHADITKTMIYLHVVERDTRIHMDNIEF